MGTILFELAQFCLFSAVVLFPFAVAAYLFFLCGTFLEEGTGKLVLKFGAYHKTLIARTGFTVDARGNIVIGQERHLLGGWRWVGLWPIYRVFKKETFRWTKTKPDGKLEDKEDHNVSKLLLRFYVYGMKSENAEDKNLVPVNSSWSVTAWTINLKNAWLDTEDWFGTFRSRILPYIRHHVTLHTYQDIIAKDDVRLDKEVEATLLKEGILDELRNRHGIHVVAIECVDISPDEKFRVDTLKRWEAEREAERRRLERLGSTSGAVMAMIADQIGVDVKEIQAEFKKSSVKALKKYAGLIRMNRDFVLRQMGLDAGAVRQYYFHGAKGGMDLVALLGDVFRGASGEKASSGETKTSSKKRGGRKNAKDLSPEERRKAHERIKAGLPPLEDGEDDEEEEGKK